MPAFLRKISDILSPRAETSAEDLAESSRVDDDQEAFAGADWQSCGDDYAAAAKAAAHEDRGKDDHNIDALKKLVPKLDLDKRESVTGDTLLLTASVAGNAAAASVLLEAGASVNLENKSGFTPLHAASRFGGSNCVRVLLNYGAALRAELPDGRTALDLALVAQEEADNAHLDRLSSTSGSGSHLSRRNAHHRPDMVVALLQQLEDEQFEQDERAALKAAQAQADESVARASAAVQLASKQG